MWLYIRTELESNRFALGLSFVAAVIISPVFGAAFPPEADDISILFRIIYVASIIIGTISYQSEKRERLYAQLPLKRFQIVLGNLSVLLIWTALFYGGACITIFAYSLPVKSGFFTDMLALYFLLVAVMAIAGIAIELRYYRQRYLWFVYLVAALIVFSILIGNDTKLVEENDRLNVYVMGMQFHIMGFSSITAVLCITILYLAHTRRDYYLE